MKTRRRSLVLFGLLSLQLQRLGASVNEHFVLIQKGNASTIPSGVTLLPLELSSVAASELLTTKRVLRSVTFDSYVTDAEWTLNSWSAPLSQMRLQERGTAYKIQVDLRLTNAPEMSISKLLVLADPTPLESVELSLSFGKNALANMPSLVQVHVDGMNTTFEDQWLPAGVDLNQLIFDRATVHKFKLGASVSIRQVIIRNSTLSFPTAVLDLMPAVKTLVLEYNTIMGPIELTADKYSQLTNISDLRLIGNVEIMARNASSSCIKKEIIGDLTICIVKEMTSPSYSLYAGSDDSASSNKHSTGPLETQATGNSDSPRSALSITAIVVGCACTVIIAVFLSFFRRFKRKASKFVDERLAFTNRDENLLAGHRNEPGMEHAILKRANILAAMDLCKDQTTLYKKIGVQGLWLGEYKDTKVVALKFIPREINMVIEELNAILSSYVPLRHNHIVAFVGCSWTEREEFLIVVEHMSKGNLRTVLADNSIELSWSQRLQMSKDICSGLNFIRSLQGSKLSRNLTARSVLVDSQLTCKLDIFDYALSLRTNFVPLRSYGLGDIASRAPELLKGDEMTAAAEVYALGVIFCEITSRQILFEHLLEERGSTLADIFIATEVVAQRLTPSLAEDVPADYRELIFRCLSYEPSERPNVAEIFKIISK